jgi:cysteine desulfurase family protein (TIGR01976 family)
MPSIDTERLRKQFPALQREIGGRPIVFADAPGGTQVPQPVIDAMADYLTGSNANQGGAFATSVETDSIVESARAAAADLLGCAADEIVFGPNMTTLAFALSRVMARTLRPGDEIVVTNLDHDANIEPWAGAARDAGAVIRRVDFDPSDCTIDLDSLDASLSDRTRLVAFSLASNAVGTIPPAAEIVERVRKRTDAHVIADAVHFAPHRLLDTEALGVDFLFCSPYKFFGPHLGVMYGRRELLEELRPYKVRPSPDDVPDRWESGTKSHEALAGLIACVDYLCSISDDDGDRRNRIVAAMDAIAEHEAGLSLSLLDGLSRLEGVTLYGLAQPERIGERTPTFALRLEGFSPRAVAERLNDEGIFVWDGNYYALAVMERLGLEETGGAVRVGLCHYHSNEDVERVVDALGACVP